MADHPNLDAARAGYAAFAAMDTEEVMGLLADDVVWHVAGSNALSGDYKGKEAVMGLFGQIYEGTEGTFSLEIHDMLANDDHGVALVSVSGSRGDYRMSGEKAAHIFHMEDGKMTEFWSFAENQHVFDQFWT